MLIDYISCNGVISCPSNGGCVVVCAANAVYVLDDKPVIDEESCVSCGLCVQACPKHAIYFPK